MTGLTLKELDQLEALDKAATQGPWAYMLGCGTVVAVGEVAYDRRGETALMKGGYSLFEIEPDAYDRLEDELESTMELRAQADAKLIAMMRNSLPALIALARKASMKDPALQIACQLAHEEERQSVVNYLFSVNARDLAKEILAGEHLKDIDPS